MIRVLIVEDQTIIRQGLRRLLEAQSDLEIIGEAENGQQAIDQVAQDLPDVVLMDIRMPIMDGLTATQIICDRFPRVKVLILTTFDDEQYIEKLMQMGTIGYLLKDTPSEELAQAIRSAHRGYTQLSPGLFQKIFPKQGTASPIVKSGLVQSHVADLTPREQEVLSLIAMGSSNREIAEMLCISEKTVKNHVSNILSRLNLRDRTQAAVFAHSLPASRVRPDL
jgi:DNA-binding NarL/FixJ family response regulator